MKSLRSLCLLFLVMPVIGCDRRAMFDQPRLKPLAESSFFEDGRASRPLVEGTIPRGSLAQHEVPRSFTRADLQRGKERYEIFCAVCHDRVGNGQGMIVLRGYTAPPSFHTEERRRIPLKRIFDVISRGQGTMPSYASLVRPHDRWLIVAYVRTLQLSQNAQLRDVPQEEQEKLR